MSDTTSPGDLSMYEANGSGDDVQVIDLIAGEGPQASGGQSVSVHYRGWLTNGTKFDESYARGSVFTFTLGAHQVIEGWDRGVAGMRVGGKRRLVIPPALGYGQRGAGPIPPQSVLVFDVELIDIG